MSKIGQKWPKFEKNKGGTQLCPVITALRKFFGFKGYATSIEDNQTSKISKNKKICRRDWSHPQKRPNFPHIAPNPQSTKISDFLRKSSRSKLLSISLKENAEIFLFNEFFNKKIQILDYQHFFHNGGGWVFRAMRSHLMAGI